MKLTAVLRFSFTNLWRRKLRSILTIWAMSVGIGAMVLLLAFAAGLQQEAEKSLYASISLTQLQVMAEKPSASTGSSTPKMLTEDDLKKLREIGHVKGVFTDTYVPASKMAWKDTTVDVFFQVMPVEAIDQHQRDRIDAGAWWTSNDEEVVVLSQKTMTSLKTEPKDLVGQTVTLKTEVFSEKGTTTPGKDVQAKVSGVLKDDNAFMGMGGPLGVMPYGFAKKIAQDLPPSQFNPQPEGTYFQANVYVDAKENVTRVRQAMQDKGYYVTSAEDMLKDISQGFLIMKIVLGIIGGIALFVALIGITNSMLMAVLERTKEIGILASLGASRRTVSRLFLAEAAWLGLLGALVGIGGAYLIGKLIVAGFQTYASIRNLDQNTIPPITFHISWMLTAATIIGAVVVTLIAGWLPARRAAKQDPVKALRHE